MKIAFFTDTYLPTHDGVAHVVADIAHTLARAGHEVMVFTVGSPDLPTETREPSGVQVVRTSSIPLPYYSQYRTAVMPWRVGDEKLKGTDIVHIHTPGMVGFSGLLAGRHRDIPILGTFHTNIRDMRKSLPDNWFTRKFFRYFWLWNLGIYARCNLVTVPAQPARDLMLSSFRTGKGAPVVVLPNGIDLTRFHPGIVEPDWPDRVHAKGQPLLTYLGRLTEDKGVHRFLQALQQLPTTLDWHGVIGGEGPEEPELRRVIESDPVLSKRVSMLGSVLEDEKAALLSQSRAFVLASTADVAPVVMLEAMASGATLVVTKRGGPGEMIQDGTTGLLVDPEDSRSIAGALESTLTDPAMAERLSRQALQWVSQNASIDRTAQELLRTYQALERRAPIPLPLIPAGFAPA